MYASNLAAYDEDDFGQFADYNTDLTDAEIAAYASEFGMTPEEFGSFWSKVKGGVKAVGKGAAKGAKAAGKGAVKAGKVVTTPHRFIAKQALKVGKVAGKGVVTGVKATGKGIAKVGKFVSAQAFKIATKPIRMYTDRLVNRRAGKLAWDHRKSKQPTPAEKKEAKDWAKAKFRSKGYHGKLIAMLMGPPEPSLLGLEPVTMTIIIAAAGILGQIAAQMVVNMMKSGEAPANPEAPQEQEPTAEATPTDESVPEEAYAEEEAPTYDEEAAAYDEEAAAYEAEAAAYEETPSEYAGALSTIPAPLWGWIALAGLSAAVGAGAYIAARRQRMRFVE